MNDTSEDRVEEVYQLVTTRSAPMPAKFNSLGDRKITFGTNPSLIPAKQDYNLGSLCYSLMIRLNHMMEFSDPLELYCLGTLS